MGSMLMDKRNGAGGEHDDEDDPDGYASSNM